MVINRVKHFLMALTDVTALTPSQPAPRTYPMEAWFQAAVAAGWSVAQPGFPNSREGAILRRKYPYVGVVVMKISYSMFGPRIRLYRKLGSRPSLTSSLDLSGPYPSDIYRVIGGLRSPKTGKRLPNPYPVDKKG